MSVGGEVGSCVPNSQGHVPTVVESFGKGKLTLFWFRNQTWVLLSRGFQEVATSQMRDLELQVEILSQVNSRDLIFQQKTSCMIRIPRAHTDVVGIFLATNVPDC